MIYTVTLAARKNTGFSSVGNAISNDTVNFRIVGLTEGQTYQWFIKANTTDADIDAIAGDTGTVQDGDELIEFSLPAVSYTVGTTYYFALRQFDGSESQEVIQVSFAIAQNAVLGQGTTVLNINPLFLPNFTTAERDAYTTGSNALLIYNTTTEQIEQYNPDTDSWSAFAGASGDVTGPASSTDNAVARFNSTTGKVIQGTNFIIDDNGNVTINPDSTAQKADLTITSSNAGGLNTSDSTGRIILDSYQKAQFNADGGGYAHYGEVIRIYPRAAQAKAMIAWYDGYDSGTRFGGDDSDVTKEFTFGKTTFWIGYHPASNDDPNLFQNQASVEVPDENGLMQSVFEWNVGEFGTTTKKIGIPTSQMYSRSIRHLLAAGVGLTIEDGARLYFANTNYADTTGRRYAFELDESDGLRINRYNASGSFVSSPFIIDSSGRFGFNNTSPQETLHIIGTTRFDASEVYVRGTSNTSIMARSDATTGDGGTIRVTGENFGGGNTGLTTYLGGFFKFDPGNNNVLLGTHNTADETPANDIVSITLERSTGYITLNLPTSSAGLSTGQLWNDSGTVKVA